MSGVTCTFRLRDVLIHEQWTSFPSDLTCSGRCRPFRLPHTWPSIVCPLASQLPLGVDSISIDLPVLHFCGINARGARYRGRLQCIWEPRERELLAFNLSPRSCTHQAYLHTDDGQRQPDMVSTYARCRFCYVWHRLCNCRQTHGTRRNPLDNREGHSEHSMQVYSTLRRLQKPRNQQ